MTTVDFEFSFAPDREPTFIQVPPEAVAALGARKKPPVLVTLNGHTYRSTVAVYGGESFLPLRREVREASGVSPGQTLTVTLTLDDQVRTVDVPDDLARELARHPGTEARFADLSYTNQKELVAWVGSAKRPETRRRRIAQVVERLM